MSRMPDNIESKYNHNNKFKWVDSQLEKFMNRQKEDDEYIENLEGGVSEMEKKIKELENENIKLRIALCNLRDEFIDLGGNPEQLELFDSDDLGQLKIFESPDGGETVYERKAGDYENRKKIK